MSMGVRILALAVFAACSLAPSAKGQSLGAAAQKEKEKRAAKPRAPEPKVITTEDLEANRPAEATESAPPPAEPGGRALAPPRRSKEAKPPADPDEPPSVDAFGGSGGGGTGTAPSGRRTQGVADEAGDREAQERSWRSRGAAARAEIAAAERAVRDADQGSGQAVSQFGGDQGHEAARAQAKARLASARARLESAKRNLERLEEEARRAGIPPGWLR